MNNLFINGNFEFINYDFLTEGYNMLNTISHIQQKYNKQDMDTFINELRDSIVGNYLGYKLININKHGFDCKLNLEENIFLEIKSISSSSKQWCATFNDTTINKAQYFKNNNVYLCLAVWENASNLLFCVYGNNKKLGNDLENNAKQFLSLKNRMRSTQTINISKLIFNYNFDIICINKTKNEIQNILKLKYKKFLLINPNQFLTLKEYYIKYSIKNNFNILKNNE